MSLSESVSYCVCVRVCVCACARARARARNVVSLLNVVLLSSCKEMCIKIVFKAVSICNLHEDTLNDSD